MEGGRAFVDSNLLCESNETRGETKGHETRDESKTGGESKVGCLNLSGWRHRLLFKQWGLHPTSCAVGLRSLQLIDLEPLR
jgi:hypothetical protein